MNTERKGVDVLAVWDQEVTGIAIRVGEGPRVQALREARAAVAELIEAAKLALGDHNVPDDCYATGPLTGDPYADLVRCPGCALRAALARVQPAAKDQA